MRAGLSTRLATVSGLRVVGIAGGSPGAAGMVVVAPERVDFDETYGRGCDRLLFRCRLLVAMPDAERAVAQVVSLVDDVKAAIEDDPTLDGSAQSSRVAAAENFGTFAYGEAVYDGCEFVVDVVAVA